MILKSGLLLACVFLIFLHTASNDNPWDLKMTLLLCFYLIVTVLLTLIGREPLGTVPKVNLFPGSSIVMMYQSPWNNRGRYEFVEILGNILLFVPLGLCMRRYGQGNYGKTILTALLLSTVVELLQYTLNIGTFELDDIINNTWGAILGRNLVDITNHIRKADNWKNGLRTISLQQSAGIWPLIALCVFALSQFIRYVNNKGWLY